MQVRRWQLGCPTEKNKEFYSNREGHPVFMEDEVITYRWQGKAELLPVSFLLFHMGRAAQPPLRGSGNLTPG